MVVEVCWIVFKSSLCDKSEMEAATHCPPSRCYSHSNDGAFQASHTASFFFFTAMTDTSKLCICACKCPRVLVSSNPKL